MSYASAKRFDARAALTGVGVRGLNLARDLVVMQAGDGVSGGGAGG
jgi:hypothetical protein